MTDASLDPSGAASALAPAAPQTPGRAATTIYVDTNCFIHLRDLKDLPWREVFPDASAIEIVVAPVVIDELDRFKMDREGRKRDRSRLALRTIESASAAESLTLSLRSAPLPVALRISTGPAIDWGAYTHLDPTRPDDQLVAAALSDPGPGPAHLLSFDTGPLIRARIAGLHAVRSPETWQLADQPDAAAEETNRLRRENAALLAGRPTVSIRFTRPNAEPPLQVTRRLPDLPPLSAGIQAALLDASLARHPKQDVVATANENSFMPHNFLDGGITRAQVAEYGSDYRAFVRDTKAFLAELHERVSVAMGLVQVGFTLTNESPVTATNIKVEVRSRGAYLVEDLNRLQFLALDGPKPPDLPEERGYLPLTTTWRDLQIGPRDPTAFEAYEESDGSRVAFHCPEFRPARSWASKVWLHSGDDGALDAALEFDIDALNLPAPVHLEGRIVTDADNPITDWTDPSVLERLPTWMARIIGEASPMEPAP